MLLIIKFIKIVLPDLNVFLFFACLNALILLQKELLVWIGGEVLPYHCGSIPKFQMISNQNSSDRMSSMSRDDKPIQNNKKGVHLHS